MSARVRWMIDCTAMSFACEDDPSPIEALFRDEYNYKHLQSFLEGTSKSSRLIVVDKSSSESENGVSALMFFERLDSIQNYRKAVYFMRAAGDNKPIRQDVATGDDLLFGEISSNPLSSLHALVGEVLKPALVSGMPELWKGVPDDVKNQCLGAVESLVEDISGALVHGGKGTCFIVPPELSELVPSGELPATGSWEQGTVTLIAKGHTDAVEIAVACLDRWCKAVGDYMEASLQERLKDCFEIGPTHEIDYWKARARELVVMAEQLRTGQCRFVVQLANSAHLVGKQDSLLLAPVAVASKENKGAQSQDIKSPSNGSAQSTGTTVGRVLLKWKDIEALLAVSSEEAKDNVRYLVTLEKLVEPLYSGTPVEVLECLPSLMNSVQLIYAISRYYNTQERMGLFLARVTGQIIANCSAFLLNGRSDCDRLWEEEPQNVLARLRPCAAVCEGYIANYSRVKRELETSVDTAVRLELNENQIFGRLELFSRRLGKLMAMFQAIVQYEALGAHKFDGMEHLLSEFTNLRCEFRGRRHALLDVLSNKFDRDYVGFTQRLSELEAQLERFIVDSFSTIVSVEASLNQIETFGEIIRNDSLQGVLASKYHDIFHAYALELTQIQDHYEKHKSAPPLPRNVPPVAGSIEWARNLYRRIETPMKRFQHIQVVWQNRDSKEVLRMYNKLAATLTEYEVVWYNAWIDSTANLTAGLHACLFVKSPESGKLLVNFDSSIIHLMREAKCLSRLGGLVIPEQVKVMLMQEGKFKKHISELTFVLKEHKRLTLMVRPVISALLQGHLNNLDLHLRTGLTIVTWTSMNVSRYVEDVTVELARFEQLLKVVNDYIDSRIESGFKSISASSFCWFPKEDERVTPAKWMEQQAALTSSTSSWLVRKSKEIETSVDDMLTAIAKYRVSDQVECVSEAAVLRVKSHYFWMLRQSILAASKESLKQLRDRMSSGRPGAGNAGGIKHSPSGSATTSPGPGADAGSASASGAGGGHGDEPKGRNKTGSGPMFSVFFSLTSQSGHASAGSSGAGGVGAVGGATGSTSPGPASGPSSGAGAPSAAPPGSPAVGSSESNECFDFSPKLSEVWEALVQVSQLILRSSEQVASWETSSVPADITMLLRGDVTSAASVDVAASSNRANSTGSQGLSGSQGPSGSQGLSAGKPNPVLHKGSSMSGSSTSIGSVHERIMQDKDLLKTLLLMTGAFQGSRQAAQDTLQKYKAYESALGSHVKKSEAKRAENASQGQSAISTVTGPSSGPSGSSSSAITSGSVTGGYSELERTESLLREVVRLEQGLGTVEPATVVGPFEFKNERLVAQLRVLCEQWRGEYSSGLHKKAKTDLESVSEQMRDLHKRISKPVEVGDVGALCSVMETLDEVRKQQSDIELLFGPVEHMYSVLDQYMPAGLMDKDERDSRSVLRSTWGGLIAASAKIRADLSSKQSDHRANFVQTLSSFKADVKTFQEAYDAKGPMVAGIAPMEAVERLKRFKEELDVKLRRRDLYFRGEHLFGLPHQALPALDQIKKDLGYLAQLYDLYVQVLDAVKEWKEFAWSDIGTLLPGMVQQVEQFAGRCKKMPVALRNYTAYGELKKEIEYFSELLPLLQDLSKKSVLKRHWDQVRTVTGKDLRKDMDNVKLSVLIDANLPAFKDDIVEICEGADKQLAIFNKLVDIRKLWLVMEFQFSTWKNRDYPCILSGGRVVEVQEQLEEWMMGLNTINAMRHSAPFKAEISELLSGLSEAGEVIEKWAKVQMLWTGLESVFTGGDIAKQMPVEAKKFAQLDKEWVSIFSKSVETKTVMGCCKNDHLLQMLPVLRESLEGCQRSLDSYLEGKRNKFPRFFFVSDPVLLKILSQGSDPENVQDDLEKLFDAISRVDFDKADKRKIVRIKNIMGTAEESLDLSMPVMAVGNIEDWLTNLEQEMQRSVKRECRFAMHVTGAVMTSMSLRDFADKFIAQVGLLGIQVIWTADVQEALTAFYRDKNRTPLANCTKKFQQMMTDLVNICLSDLKTKQNRTKFETLVTIHVHQRDVFGDIQKRVKEHRITSDSDFEWLKQTRFYWKTERDTCLLSVADVDFPYQYEYLGVKERLVITPLTDRCYLSLSQAMGMCYGGAPAGPAGTGKTETVKDMGRSIGTYVIVTNCSDQHRYRDMAKIFKGLCQSGLWGCFDEFNRIELDVLSVVAMQVESIALAKKQHAKQFMFPGEVLPTKLNPSAGYFITMNPGYAGRQELPENLKVLFRSVSMMVPDREIIMRVKLASVGYSQMDMLAKKFNVLYNLCEQQLSKQRHYDFGLRNILSVLRTAGGAKRAEPPDADEEMIFMRTVRDMNLSKLVADDVPLFQALLRDIFPRITDPPKKVYAEMENGLNQVIKAKHLSNLDSWRLKVVQVYETSLVRHGFMLVGPTLCGKTEIIQTLTSSLSDHCASPHRIVTLNSKAFTEAQMYGVKDPLSGEWTPGVFSSIWQKYNNRALKYTTWIVCDSPIDTLWIENLNSVLDDNKILTLANNDRIAMTDNCRIVFEVENLNNASPATVSRAGIIYVSESDLGWTPLVESWLARRKEVSSGKEVEAETFKTAMEKYLVEPDLIEYSRKNLKSVMRINSATVVNNTLNLLSGVVAQMTTKPQETAPTETLTADAYMRIFLYCLCWGLGGLAEPDDRRKLSEKICELARSNGAQDLLPTDLDSSSSASHSLFDYYCDQKSKGSSWLRWAPDKWEAPTRFSFSSVLIPTLESCRLNYIVSAISRTGMGRQPLSFQSTLLVGATGCAKTSTALMYTTGLNANEVLSKRINFSSATTPATFQRAIEAEVERKTGKTFCPPGGKRMVVFLDDVSMPQINMWGDQVTLEIVRQLMEQGGVYFLDKDKRGDFRAIEGLFFVACMTNPGGGKNDIPNRAKSKYFPVNVVMPNIQVVDSIYGSILRARYSGANCEAFKPMVQSLTSATIDCWEKVKTTLLPTPQRFQYVFNMHDLSRIFQGIFSAPIESLTSTKAMGGEKGLMASLWRHECLRVFGDKLSRQQDRDFVIKTLSTSLESSFGSLPAGAVHDLWADFQRDAPPPKDETEDPQPAPRIYEPVASMDALKRKAYEYLADFNGAFPAMQMGLVLFDDALAQLVKIARIIGRKRGNALLAGVGGSGKQSLTRLAALICRQRCFQIPLTSSYNDNSFCDDLRSLYIDCGRKGNQVTFLLTDAELKSESFLEHMNSTLATGDAAGLFQKEEKDAMCGELRSAFILEKPGMEDSMRNLRQFFTERVLDNLHVVFSFSPMNPKFPLRAQKFPAVFSNSAICWFSPWPQEALVAVSTNVLGKADIDTTPEVKTELCKAVASFHSSVSDMCQAYYSVMRRNVYVTPKSYLCLLDLYKRMFMAKHSEINLLERAVNAGLQKLATAQEDVHKMEIVLHEEEANLKVAEAETNTLLVKVQAETAKANAIAAEVSKKRDVCLTKKGEIEVQKNAAQKDLEQALPFLHEAEEAVKSIQPKDIIELKTLKQPTDIIRVVFDGVLLLQQKKVVDVKSESKSIAKQTFGFIHDSYDEFAKTMLIDIHFLSDILEFSALEKDNITEETCELLEPYLRLSNFTPAVAKKASSACEGLCKWVGAMVMYHKAAKVVKPKMDFLKVQTAKLNVAMADLAAAEAELAAAQAVVDELNKKFQEAMDRKTALEIRANTLKRRMDMASKLLKGLAGEQVRWSEDSSNFAERRKRLVGDVAVAAAFVTYCGAFNADFRQKLQTEHFAAEVTKRKIPHDEHMNLLSFLVDQSTVGEWSLQGLPSDDLSVQNGIIVTKSSRFALLVDPQGQALRWLKNKEASRIAVAPQQCVTTLSNPRLKDQLEFCMGEGLCLIIENVENEVNPMLDPVLDRAVVKKGKTMSITVGDHGMDFNPNFTLYMTSRLPNPKFSPELSAKCTVVDFTVTQKGLEQQLLGRLLSMEQKTLEERLTKLHEEITGNTKALQQLDKQLLERLSSSQGNLLDDTELVEVLASTKAKAKEVEEKLKDAEDKKVEINQRRDQYRRVATRGSVLYFTMSDMTMVSNPVTSQPTGWMYNCSLGQFLTQFDQGVRVAEKAPTIPKRVEKIVDCVTYQVYRYMNRGLFERDRVMFKLMFNLQIMVTDGILTGADIGVLLKGGSSLDGKSEKANPLKWLPDKAWLNVLQLSRHQFGSEMVGFFKDLPDYIVRGEAAWRKWFDDNEPERSPIPNYEERIAMDKQMGHFIRLSLVRSLREDRVLIASQSFVERQLDPKYTQPTTDTVESIYDESSCRRPVMYLLSAGSDPVSSIDELAKKKKKFPTEKVSMGEGQDGIAMQKMKNGFITGSWLILQNCHLGLGFMAQIEEILTKTAEIHEEFRLWITCEVTNKFPIGLLHLATKVTLEPPAGLKAGLHKTCTSIVSQETLDKVDSEHWRHLVWVQVFMHSIVQERRKFGAMGWCVPYEFNNSDLEASLSFLEKHVTGTITVGQPVSWPTVQYMIAEVQYGGRVTDDLDRELLTAYAARWLVEDVFQGIGSDAPGGGGAASGAGASSTGLSKAAELLGAKATSLGSSTSKGSAGDKGGKNSRFTFNSYASDFDYVIPKGTEISAMRQYIESIPAVDSPAIFGLHPNADLSYRTIESSSLLNAIREARPRESPGAVGKSKDELVKEKCLDILSKMPADYVEEQFREKIAKHKGQPSSTDKGFMAPLNIFLFQELQRMQRVISIVRPNLKAMVSAIDGSVVMTPELMDDINMVFDGRIPKKWTHDASGAEISWLQNTLGSWFSGMLDRTQQLNTWLEGGRGVMKGFWLAGFLNPQGFLTAVRQEVTRQHKKDHWALDDVVMHTDILMSDIDKVKDVPDEGQNIYGLYLEGAKWNRLDTRLDESEPKKIFSLMPVIHVTAMTAKDRKAKVAADFGQTGPYDCPVYKYPKRTDKYLVCRINLKTIQPPWHWKLRGVAMLCQNE